MENRKPEMNLALDRQILEEFYEGDVDHMAAVFEQFLQTSPSLLLEAGTLFEAGDIGAFRKQIHKIKPIFSFVGKPGLTELAEAIEKQCHTASDIAELSTLFRCLKEDHRRLMTVIENEIGTLQALNNLRT